MKLEDQITSLELSKKLKELGVKQESLFYYIDCNDDIIKISTSAQIPYNIHNGNVYISTLDFSLSEFQEYYSAFTASELLEMILRSHLLCLSINKHEKEYYIYYNSINDEHLIFNDKNFSNSFAKMLIYLIENKLMELPK